jgi:hypothetical protein|tara:strand:- start:696 stop:968 length:273 start_codon:yes stop_codon:yes gene_type:complete
MATKSVLKMAGVAAVLICLILLIIPTSRPVGATESNCGSVLARKEFASWSNSREACDIALNDRLTTSLVIGAVGVAALFGASQVNKRENN